MTLPPDSLAALREAAATRPDVERLVLVEHDVEPADDLPFADRRLVAVLDELPDAPHRSPVRSLVALFGPILRPHGTFAVGVPSSVGLRGATEGGTVVYERGAA